MNQKNILFVTSILSAFVLIVSFQNCQGQSFLSSELLSEKPPSVIQESDSSQNNEVFLTCRIQNVTPSHLHMSVHIQPKAIHSGLLGGFFLTARSEGYTTESSQGDRIEKDEELFILNRNNIWTKVTPQNMKNLLENPSSGLVTLNSSGHSFNFNHGLDILPFQGRSFKIFIGYGTVVNDGSIWDQMTQSSSQLQECYTIPRAPTPPTPFDPPQPRPPSEDPIRPPTPPQYAWEIINIPHSQCRVETLARWQYSDFGSCINDIQKITPTCIEGTGLKDAKELKCKNISTGEYVALSFCPATTRPSSTVTITESCLLPDSQRLCNHLAHDRALEKSCSTKGIQTLNCSQGFSTNVYGTLYAVWASITPEAKPENSNIFYFSIIEKNGQKYIKSGNNFIEMPNYGAANQWSTLTQLNGNLAFAVNSNADKNLVNGGKLIVGYGFGSNRDSAADDMLRKMTLKECGTLQIPSTHVFSK
jgi:hypothetical protein